MSRIDVLIPNYNYARFLEACVRSVQAQQVDDLRIVIIDNASNDDSVEVIDRLMAEDARIEKVVHERNIGAQGSYNEAIDLATSEYFMILCSDDFLKPGILRRALAALDANPSVAFAFGSGLECWVGDGPVVPKPCNLYGYRLLDGADLIRRTCLTLARNLAAGELVVRTAVQKEVGHYRAELFHMDDLELMLRLALKGQVIELDGALIVKRLHQSSQSLQLWQDRLAELREKQEAFESFFMNEGGSDRRLRGLESTTRRCLAEAAIWSAASHFARGQARRGRDLLHYGYRVNPRSLLIPPVRHLFVSPGARRRIGDVGREMAKPLSKMLGNGRTAAGQRPSEGVVKK